MFYQLKKAVLDMFHDGEQILFSQVKGQNLPTTTKNARTSAILLVMSHWKYKNLTFLFISLIIAFFVLQNEQLHSFLMHLGKLGYVGAFFAGMLFVSTFTVATGAIILLVLAETLSPVQLSVIAGFGAVMGDVIIFQFVKDDLAKEIKLLYKRFDKNHHFEKVLHTRYFSWSLPVLGAIIIASPLPDELGVSLMGISKLKTYQFLLLSFVLNAIGIFLVTSSSVVLKP